MREGRKTKCKCWLTKNCWDRSKTWTLHRHRSTSRLKHSSGPNSWSSAAHGTSTWLNTRLQRVRVWSGLERSIYEKSMNLGRRCTLSRPFNPLSSLCLRNWCKCALKKDWCSKSEIMIEQKHSERQVTFKNKKNDNPSKKPQSEKMQFAKKKSSYWCMKHKSSLFWSAYNETEMSKLNRGWLIPKGWYRGIKTSWKIWSKNKSSSKRKLWNFSGTPSQIVPQPILSGTINRCQLYTTTNLSCL